MYIVTVVYCAVYCVFYVYTTVRYVLKAFCFGVVRVCMIVYQKFVNTIAYKPRVGISPNYNVGAVGDEDEFVRF